MENRDIFQKDAELENQEEERSLGKLAVKGGLWVFALKIFHRGLGLLRTIILARLLSPDDFGLMGIAVLAINTVETFSKTGIEPALVQKKADIKDYLDTAWTVQLIRSVALFALLYSGAPLVAHFFKTPQTLHIIRVLAFLELFSGARNIGTVYFQKELRFDKRFALEFSGLIVNMAVSITLAFTMKSVWALIYGSLSGALVTCVASYILHPHKPRLSFHFGKAKELFHFGKWLFGSSILIFLIMQGDDVFVGRMLGITALGFYQMAYRFSNISATEITHLLSQVSFPAYSKIQDNIPRLREAYLKVLQFTVFISFIISGLIFVLASDFTKLFLGEKWMSIVPTMRILCIFGLIRSFGATTGSLFYGVGKPDILTKLAVIQLTILLAIIYPLTKSLGILGTSVAVVIPNFITQIVTACCVINIIKCRITRFIRVLFLPLFSVIIVVFLLLFVTRAWDVSIISFIMKVLFGVTCYLGIVYFFDILFGHDTIKLIKVTLLKAKNII